MTAVQLAPHPSAAGEGVGGYATAMAAALATRGTKLGFLTPGDLAPAAGVAGTWQLPRTAAGIAKALELTECETVLLHYSGYGYSRRGVPAWLPAGLEAWKRGAASRRLVTFFHEIYATGPPWRSSFWLSLFQRRIAAALAQLSDGLWTTLDHYAEALRPWGRGRSVAVWPVFSTVGEPPEVRPLAQRSRRLVVFGSAGVRRRSFEPALALTRACELLEIEEVVDVGPALALPARIAGVPLRQLGSLPAAEVSELLLDSAAGYLTYQPRYLPKSTIFAAYCAYGVLPVCATRGAPEDSRLHAGECYLDPTGPLGTSGEAQTIASSAHAWYSGHRLSLQAAALDSMLRG